MANATGEVVETPTEELPYKAVIKADDGQIIGEQFFASRIQAELFIVETLNGLGGPAGKEG